ncbi:Na/Pi cotransporter family protein [Chromobacterium subtsugae]|uniref:Na/Pi cotransporter family protein n=1 Tax=Chromobacterium subtsugae TaxID=251747 RepID=UPI000640E298|nr:Na/Pi cotransporter family protein [Chromobacterium subtsugae]
MASTVLLDLIGGVALLLWGLHMVHSGIVRAFGANMRHWLGRALRNRALAFLAGFGMTALLQSSTATALMLTSFSVSGMVELTPALAVMLGANVGTTLIVQLLSFHTSLFSPVLLIGGVIAFKRGSGTLTRDMGRVAIGLGLMLLSLHALMETLAPAENAPLTREVLAALTHDPMLNLLIGAFLSWAAHSSVATVLLVMSLSASHFIAPGAALALVLGANLGSAINPLLEAASGGNSAARRLPLGNLINRVAGCAIFLPALGPVAALLATVDPDPWRQPADFHTAFNLLMAALFMLPLKPLAGWLERLLPEQKAVDDLSAPQYLDASALETPTVALACAARETLHMGDIIEDMLRKTMTVLQTDDRKLMADVSRLDDAVDGLHEAVKFYLVRLTSNSLEEQEGRKAMEIMALSVNLEHIGDIIDKNLMELAGKKIKHKLQFSREGAEELAAMHRTLIGNLKLAFSLFLSGDIGSARCLLDEKAKFRELELAMSESHLARLREGRLESLESSSLHLDILRDFKRIHSHICATAYPILEEARELHPTRLKPLPLIETDT